MSSRHISRRNGFFLVMCASISWGTVGISNQIIDTSIATNALSLAFWRLVIAAPLFALAYWISGGRNLFQIKPRDLGIMLLMGGLQGLYQASYSTAIPETGVTVSTLVALCVAPVLVALASIFITHVRISLLTLIALVLALGGTVLLVMADPHASTGKISLLGVLFALLAAAGYAGFILCGRLLSHNCHPLQVNTVAFGSGALLLLLLSSTNLTLTYPTWGWLLLLYLGSIPTAGAYALFLIGMRSLSATVGSIVSLCEALTSALLAWILFHEQLSPFGLLGAVLLLGAMIMILLRRTDGEHAQQDVEITA